MSEKEKILQSLEPLFERAKRNKLWFHCGYQDLWFSPQELRAEQANGRFIWGPVNWNLRSPYELINELKTEIKKSEQTIDKLRQRISAIEGGELAH